MIKNISIPLASNAQERVDAANTIKYTLLLDYKTPVFTETNTDFVSQVMEQCQKCCRELFTTSNFEPDYCFFGSPDIHRPDSDSLTFLRSSSVVPDDGLSFTTIHTMILQNCVMSSYHAILSALTEKSSITSYKLVNDIKKNGIHTLYKKKILLITENGMSFAPSKSATKTKNEKKSSKASTFNSAMKSRLKSFPEFFEFMLLGETSTDRFSHFHLQFSSICRFLQDNLDLCSFKNLYSIKGNLRPQNFLDSLRKNITTLTPAIQNFNNIPGKNFSFSGNDIIDGMYHYYLMERIFGFNLFYSLIRNIERAECNPMYHFTGEYILKTLSTFMQFPNPFSRTYFLRFAFDHINPKTDSYADFWNYHDINKRDTIVSSTRKEPIGFRFDKWLLQYELFVKLMAHYIIPIYDWCFLILLLESIEAAYPDQTHYYHLEKAMNSLTSYITTNYKTILRPYIPPNNKDLDDLDIISEKNFDTIYNFISLRKDDIQILQREFLFHNKNSERSLNFLPLNPSIFKGKDKKNLRQIQDFYFDLSLYPVP